MRFCNLWPILVSCISKASGCGESDREAKVGDSWGIEHSEGVNNKNVITAPSRYNNYNSNTILFFLFFVCAYMNYYVNLYYFMVDKTLMHAFLCTYHATHVLEYSLRKLCGF
jgi:hypothetical protein